jgi:hypothetical protein
MAGAAQPGGLGRLIPRDYSHVARSPLRAVMPAIPPFTVESTMDPRLDVWSLARANQGTTERCVGYGRQRTKTILDGVEFDPDWLWRRCKEIDGFGDVNAERGTTCHAASVVLCQVGDVRVKDGSDLDPDPAYGILSDAWAGSVDELRQCFLNRIPVHIGIDWGSGYDQIEEHNGEPWIGRNGIGTFRGGHAPALVNASDERQAFQLCNSWDIPIAWFPYREMERALDNGGEAAITTDRPGPVIGPTPIPTPSARIPAGAVSARPLTLLSVLQSGASAVVLEDGIYYPLHLSQLSNLWIGARHVGKVAFRSGVADDRGPSVGMRLEECEGVTVDGIGFARAGCGVRATDCRNLTFHRVYSHHHAVEGFIFGAESSSDAQALALRGASPLGGSHDGLLMIDCEAWLCGRGMSGYDPDHGHALYVSYGSRNVHIQRFFGHEVGGSGIQCNGKQSESGSPLRNVLVEDSRFRNTGLGSSGGANVMSCEPDASGRSVEFARCAWEWTPDCPETQDWSRNNAGGVACFDDGGTAHGVVLDTCTVKGAHLYGVQAKDGATVSVKASSIAADENVREAEGGTITSDDATTWSTA